MNTPRFLTLEKIGKPRKAIVPLAIGLSWRDDGAIYQEKLDGQCHYHKDAETRSLFSGEMMAGGRFVAWDVLEHDGEDVRGRGALERVRLLASLCLRASVVMVPTAADGGALIQDVLARGGEGVVRKLASASYFDPMEAAKRLQTWRCVVTALDYSTGGARIADELTGEDRGTVPLRNRAMACRVGSLVKVEGMELTAAGKIREPRPCKDTETSWLIQF